MGDRIWDHLVTVTARLAKSRKESDHGSRCSESWTLSVGEKIRPRCRAFGAARQEGPAASDATSPIGFPLLPPRADVLVAPSNDSRSRPTEPRPEVSQLDLRIAVDPFNTGWNAAIGRPPKVVVEGLAFDGQTPKILSVQCRRAPIKTFSFTFPEAPAWALNQPAKKPDARPPLASPPPEPRPDRKSTRIAPPNDVIKLHDRLYYVLQPSLESLVATNSLEFPFEPFPYQLEGIAFLVFPLHGHPGGRDGTGQDDAGHQHHSPAAVRGRNP